MSRRLELLQEIANKAEFTAAQLKRSLDYDAAADIRGLSKCQQELSKLVAPEIGIEVESHSNKVLDMKGEVLSTTTNFTFKKVGRDNMPKPDDTGACLLNSRQILKEYENITDQVKKAGVDLGESMLSDSKYLAIKVHYYVWWQFLGSLLKATKNRQDLKDWSPDLFEYDETCADCKGEGRFPYTPGTPEYDKAFEEWKFDGDEYGMPMALGCKPCQGLGFVYKRPDWYKKETEGA